MPEVYFYVPLQELINAVPRTITEYWKWISEFLRNTHAKLPGSGAPITWAGPYNWTVQTFIYLRAYGFPCELTATLPDQGIIISHGDFLPAFLKPTATQFIVEIKPDRSLRCVFANFVVVQNRRDPVRNGIKRFLIESTAVNNWPQAGLIPRDPLRGDRFENICYMGNHYNFLSEVDVLESEIKKLGLEWSMAPRDNWHDYREVDAIAAVRPLDWTKRSTPHLFSPNRKPAAKLINAWLAGTPAILSPDIAYEDIRRSELDYLRASNVMEIIGCLKLLMKNPQLRRDMAQNGENRAAEFSAERTVELWIDALEKHIIPKYIIWRKTASRRAFFFLVRKSANRLTGIDF